MPLSPENISIDILNGFIYLVATWRVLVALYHNHLSHYQRVILGGFSILGLIYIFQTVSTVLTGSVASIFMWDIHNFIGAWLALSIVTLLKKDAQIRDRILS